MSQSPQSQISVYRGYIEGYYGRLLDWEERAGILTHLAELGFDSYLYAPKDDPYHRAEWRIFYDDSFISDFRQFTQTAKKAGIQILAGIAPGLDFDFTQPEADTLALIKKASQLVHAGADAIVLMFDDISDDITAFAKSGLIEGACHAKLAAKLQTKTGQPVMLVPRLYSDEISGDHEGYCTELNQYLPADMPVLLCGETIIAKQVNLSGRAGILGNQLRAPKIIWDNLYCNDYCPRRLFLGPYEGRAKQDPILLNGTGLYHTDRLLLSLMSSKNPQAVWRDAGVPETFEHIWPFFYLPHFSGQIAQPASLKNPEPLLQALDSLLWQWKAPLAREWYPYLFGLKQDIQIACDNMPEERIAKTQTALLSTHLLARQK